jgi:hypothetical protein
MQKTKMAQSGNAQPGGGAALSDHTVQHRSNFISFRIRH